jgi:hypothetical protein
MSTMWAWKALNSQERIIYSIFTKIGHPHAYTSQSYQDHSYTSKELTSKIISSHPTYHSDYCIKEKHISKAYNTNVVYDTKMLIMIWNKNENARCICTWDPPTEAQQGKTTPSSPRKRANVAWSKGFVRISVSCFSVGTWIKSMFPLSTLSLRKW